MTGLSVLARGTVEEKLEWAFGLYDIDGDGVIGRDEMLNIVTSIYDMIGKCAVPSVDETAIVEHVDNIFQVHQLVTVAGTRSVAPSSVLSGVHRTKWRKFRHLTTTAGFPSMKKTSLRHVFSTFLTFKKISFSVFQRFYYKKASSKFSSKNSFRRW